LIFIFLKTRSTVRCWSCKPGL